MGPPGYAKKRVGRGEIDMQKSIGWALIVFLMGAFGLFLTPEGTFGQTGAGGGGVPPSVPEVPGEVEGGPGTQIGPTGVLFYCGNGGICSEGLTEIKALYTAFGASPVDQLTTFPSDLSIYRLIFLVNPTTSFSSSQVTALSGFLNRGLLNSGRLVVVGDWSGFWPGAAVANALLSALGVPISFNTDMVDCGCDNFTPNISKDRLTRQIPPHGEPGLEFACTATLTLGSGAKKLAGTITGNQPFVAVHPAFRLIRGDVVVVGDSNMITDLCDPGSTDNQFWRNLFGF